jgi:hypothetical protein
MLTEPENENDKSNRIAVMIIVGCGFIICWALMLSKCH